MAPLGSDCGYGHRVAHDANCTADRQRSQNNDGIDSRSNDLDTRPYRRSQIYGRVRLIEGGFGQVGAGHGGDADSCCEQDENQGPTKSSHVTLPQVP